LRELYRKNYPGVNRKIIFIPESGDVRLGLGTEGATKYMAA
jgi:hypothetical protein